MTLSADIRRGAEMTVKTRGHLSYQLPGDNTVKACAFGAALYGKGVHKLEEDLDKIYNNDTIVAVHHHYPEIEDVKVQIPDSISKDSEPVHLADMIEYLNDIEGWSREAIADWLESLGY